MCTCDFSLPFNFIYFLFLLLVVSNILIKLSPKLCSTFCPSALEVKERGKREREVRVFVLFSIKFPHKKERSGQ